MSINMNELQILVAAHDATIKDIRTRLADFPAHVVIYLAERGISECLQNCGAWSKEEKAKMPEAEYLAAVKAAQLAKVEDWKAGNITATREGDKFLSEARDEFAQILAKKDGKSWAKMDAKERNAYRAAALVQFGDAIREQADEAREWAAKKAEKAAKLVG